MKYLSISGYLLLSFFILADVHAEENRYVTDSFSITMRTGQGTQHKIIKSIKTGTKLELLEKSDNGYAKVRIANGTEGWVLDRFLINKPVAKESLKKAEQQIKLLKTNNSKLTNQLKKIKGSSSTLEKDTSRLAKTNSKLSKELNHIKEIAANQIALNDENKTLKEQVLSLKREMQMVQQENMSLQDRSQRDWFLIGAGVCIVGVILGLILPNLRFRRKQSWSSL